MDGNNDVDSNTLPLFLKDAIKSDCQRRLEEDVGKSVECKLEDLVLHAC